MSEVAEGKSPHPINHDAGLSARSESRLSRLWFLLIAAVFVITPYAIERAMQRPSISQRYFFEWSALLLAAVYSASRLFGFMRNPPRDALRLWIVLYGILLFFAARNSPHPHPVYLNSLFPLAGLAFYVVVYGYAWTVERVARLVTFLSVAVYIAAMFGLIQGLGIKIIPYADDEILGHLNILSIFGHPNYAASFLGPALILIATLGWWRPAAIRKPTTAMAVLAAIAGLVTVSAFLLFMGASASEMTEAAGPQIKSGSINATSLATAAGAVVLGAAAWRLGWFIRLTVLATLACLITAGTRSVWIALSMSLLLCMPLLLAGARFSLRKFFLRIGLPILIFAAILAATPLRGYVIERVSEREGIAQRLYGHMIAVEMLRQRPWKGWGYGSFATEYYEQVIRFQQRDGADVFKRLLIDARGVPPGEVHNDILAIAVDGGLPAVFAFLAMVMSFVLITVRAANESRRQGNLRKKQLLVAALAAILCLLIDGMSSFPLRLATSAMLFWGVLAIGARLAQESGQPEPTLQTDETTEDGAGTGT